MSWFFDKIKWISLFRNTTSATTQKNLLMKNTLHASSRSKKGGTHNSSTVLAHTIRVQTRKGWILLPIFKCKIMVISVRIDNFCTGFLFQFRCFIQMSLIFNQRYDIKNPVFRWIEWIDTMKMNQKENQTSGTFKDYWLVINISQIQFKFLFK